MNFSKLAPWNWFRNEEGIKQNTVPVNRQHETLYPASPIAYMRREMDRLFDDFFHGFLNPPRRRYRQTGSTVDRWFKPGVDISSTDKDYTVHVELPGVDGQDVKVDISGGTLRIRGEKRQEKEDPRRNYYSRERSYGSFQRILSLPEDAKKDAITATCKNGVLKITIPREESPQTKSKPIEIKAT